MSPHVVERTDAAPFEPGEPAAIGMEQAEMLKQHVMALAVVVARRSEIVSDAVQRHVAIEQAVQLFGSVQRYVAREIDHWTARGLIEPDALAVDDLVIATYVAALEQADRLPPGRPLHPWLCRIARQEVHSVALAEAEREEHELSLEVPVRSEGEDWPDHVIRLAQVLADPQAVVPDEILSRQETRQALHRLLALLPEQWREVFLFSVVDGWDEDDVALVMELEPARVGQIVTASRAFLTAWAREIGDRFET